MTLYTLFGYGYKDWTQRYRIERPLIKHTLPSTPPKFGALETLVPMRAVSKLSILVLLNFQGESPTPQYHVTTT